MKPNYTERTLTVGGSVDSAMFGISVSDKSHIMGILRNRIYTNKVLAVIREYSSNAWDANRSVGKSNVPIKVHLPTNEDPSFRVRDYGPGLSREDIFRVYTQYGASTKRTSDDVVGMLGIGSKSGFSYSDTFMVTSWFGGKQSLYVASLDESNTGVMNLMIESDCGDETGIEVEIPVKSSDIWEFSRNAKDLFQHFQPPPIINTEIETPKGGHEFPAGRLWVKDRGINYWTAVMGCIPYKVDISNLFSRGEAPSYLHNVGGLLYFHIGEVEVSASREELEYSKDTVKAVKSKIFLLIDSFVQKSLKDIKEKSVSPWHTLLLSRDLYSVGVYNPSGVGSYTGYVNIPDTIPFKFYRGNDKTPAHSISIDERTTVVIKDDDRLLSGFSVGPYDYMARPLKGKKVVDIAEVNKFMNDAGIVGIPTKNTSTMPWVYKGRGNPRGSDGSRYGALPHDQRVFVHNGGTTKPYSSCWTYVPGKVPEKEDVYVVLEHFETDFDFYSRLSSDAGFLKTHSVDMPTIHGYRNLKRSPLDKSSLPGREYRAWYKDTIQAICEAHPKKVKTSRMHSVANDMGWGWVSTTKKKELCLEKVAQDLGRDHKLRLFVEQLGAYHEKWNNGYGGYKEMSKYDDLVRIAEELGITFGDSDVIVEMEKLYPLIYCTDMLNCMVHEDAYSSEHRRTEQTKELARKRTAYIQYVKDTDIAREAKEP